MKKILSILLCSSMLLSCVSCSKNSYSGKTVPTSESSSAAETETVTSTTLPPTTTTTTTTHPQMQPLSSPYEYMDCLDLNGVVVDFFMISGGKLVAQTVDYSNAYVADAPAKISVIDPLSDSIVRSFDLHSGGERLLGIFENGKYIVQNYYTNEFTFFDLMGDKVAAQPDMGSGTAKFSPADDCLYFAEGNTLIKKYLSDGSVQELFSTVRIGTVNDITPQGELIIDEPAADDHTPYNSSLYSISTKERIVKLDSNAYNGLVSKGRYSSWNFNSETSCPEFISVPISGGEVSRYSFEGKTIADCRAAPDSQYILVKYSSGASDIGYLFLDPATGKAADLGYTQSYNDTSVPCYISELRRWFICTSEPDQNGSSHVRLITADPELLNFDIQLTAVENKVYTPAQCGEKLKAYRDIADDIEKEFGVRILLGNEVLDAVDDTEYTFTSIEDTMFIDPELEFSDDLYIKETLDYIRKILSMYPDGFFERFKNQYGEGGLRISIVGELSTDYYESFTSGGIAYTYGAWYNIAMQYYNMSGEMTGLHHEIWHNVESLVNKSFPLSYDSWDALNPAGFQYMNDFDAYANSADISEYVITEAPEGVYDTAYFAAQYGTVNPVEDRATMIESIFYEWYDTETSEFVQLGNYKELIKYPHIKAKIDFLADWSKQEFGYVYWDEILKNNRQ